MPIRPYVGNTCCTAALLMALAAPAFSQTAIGAQSTGEPSGAPQEGIQVHGDWTLTVRNPDGVVSAVHEFKNALSVSTGADRLLVDLLGGAAVPGQWTVVLATNTPSACGGTSGGCYISEVSLSHINSTNLTKSIPASGPDSGKLVLRGSVRMVSSAGISIVTTSLSTCAATSPAPCTSLSAPEFTRKLLDALVPVSADQLVEVKVVISFS